MRIGEGCAVIVHGLLRTCRPRGIRRCRDRWEGLRWRGEREQQHGHPHRRAAGRRDAATADELTPEEAEELEALDAEQAVARRAAIGTGPGWVAIAALLDAVSILLFAFIGVRAHATDPSVRHLFEVAMPFLLAAVVGWGVVRAWRRPLAVSGSGVIVWLVTIVGGVLLRAVTLHGFAFGFLVVTSITLALFMLGWRGIVGAIARRIDA